MLPTRFSIASFICLLATTMYVVSSVFDDLADLVFQGERACNGGSQRLNKDPNFRDYVPFHEFFHADTGKGLGASHQTGWTGLVAYMIWQAGSSARLPRTPRSPRRVAAHYFDEQVATPAPSETGSEFEFGIGDVSASEISPDDL